MRTVYIYALVDPRTDAIRYVGKTVKRLRERLNQHVYESKNDIGSSYKANWIKNLLKNGLRPKIKLLEETDEKSWSERECWWIAELHKTCRLTNLLSGGQDGSHSEESKLKISLAQRGSKGSNAILTDEQVLEILYKYSTGLYGKESLGKEYGVCSTTIMKVFRRESWIYIYDNLPQDIKDKIEYERTKGWRKRAQYRKLTDNQIREIRRMHRETSLNFTQIAEFFPVKKSCVRNICRGVTWANVI